MSTEFKSLERVDRQAAYELQNRVNQIRRDAANAANQARQQAMQDAQRRIEQIRRENTQREQNIINNLRSETDNKLAQQDAEHRDALLNMSESLQGQLNEQGTNFRNRLNDVRTQNQNDINRLRNETHNLVDNLTTEMNNAFEVQNEINKNHQSQINNIKNDVRYLQQNIADQKSWAKELLTNCNINISEMDNDIAVKRFQGQELERVKKSVANAESFLESSPQSTIGNLTEARLNLMGIREKSQISQVIFESLFEQSLSGIKTLLEKIKNNKLNTRLRETNIDLAYWTNGKYREFEDKVASLENKINTALQNPTINSEIMTGMIKEISMLEAEEEKLVIEAVRNIELSHNRNVVADIAIQSLLDANFIIKHEDDEGYIAQEFSEGYYATLVNRNNEGHCVTILVDSVFDEENSVLKNRLNIQSNTTDLMDIKSMQDYQEILANALNAAGGDVSKLNVEDAKVFDANAIKNTKLTKEQKQKLSL